jgi:hypothetical protein
MAYAYTQPPRKDLDEPLSTVDHGLLALVWLAFVAQLLPIIRVIVPASMVR